jgi:hypothetical protein
VVLLDASGRGSEMSGGGGKGAQGKGGEGEIVKVIFVGSPRAGKTSIVRRLLDKPYVEEYAPSPAPFHVTFAPRRLHGEVDLAVELWDVAGAQLVCAPGCPSHRGHMCRGAEAVVFVFDLASAPTLRGVDEWHDALSPYLMPGAVKVLVGHKADVPRYVVDKGALDAYCSATHFTFWCCTVGSSEFGDYDVGSRRGAVGKKVRRDESRSGVIARQLSVWEMMDKTLTACMRAREERRVAQDHLDWRLSAMAGLSLCEPLPKLLGQDALKAVCSSLGLDIAADPFEKVIAEQLRPKRRSRSEACAEEDSGAWSAYAGNLSRSEADILLTGRPQGSYLIRRRSPSQLVICFVAGDGAAVQHVLVNFEDGHFSDQHGRLGRFPTLDAFLSSKIREVANLPLRFKRQPGSVDRILVREQEEAAHDHWQHEAPVSPAQQLPAKAVGILQEGSQERTGWKPRGRLQSFGSSPAVSPAPKSISSPPFPQSAPASGSPLPADASDKIWSLREQADLFMLGCKSKLHDLEARSPNDKALFERLHQLSEESWSRLVGAIKAVQDRQSRCSPGGKMKKNALRANKLDGSAASMGEDRVDFTALIAGKQQFRSSQGASVEAQIASEVAQLEDRLQCERQEWNHITQKLEALSC